MAYKLRENSPQWRFHESRKKLQIFGGGFGNGKTTALSIKALRLARDYPGCNGLLARSTYPKLNDTLRKVFFLWCPPNWIKRMPTKDDNTCILVNGSTINFRYIAQRGKQTESGDTTSNLLSTSYDWIGVDQAEDPEITQKDILDLFGRLRGDTPYRPDVDGDDGTMPDSGPRWMMLTLNPTRNWIYREFVFPYHQWQKRGMFTDKLLVDEDTKLPIIDLIEGSTYTNSDNLKSDYIKSLETIYKGQMKKRFLLGEWAAFDGLVYDMFESETHLLKRDFAMEYLADCVSRHVKVQLFEGYDFGLTSPSCYLLGFVDEYGRVIIIDGFYKPNFRYDEQPDKIKEIREKYSNFLDFSEAIILADPDIFKKKVIQGFPTGTTLNNLLTVNGTNGIRFRPGQNDILAGIAKVSSYLSGHNKAPHLVTGKTPGPLLYFVEDLTYIEDEIQGYYWKKNPLGQSIDEPNDHDDHSLDTIKYGLSKLPEPSQIVVPEDKLPPKWTRWHEVDDDRAMRM